MRSQELITLSEKIKASDDQYINSDFRFHTDVEGKLPLLVCCHGFKGFKDWGFFPYLMESIAEENIFTVNFNFTFNGVGDDPTSQTEFVRLDHFAQNTFSRELEDLDVILNYLSEHRDKYNYDFDNLTLIGHSRGGGIAIIKAAEDPRVKRLITVSSVSHFSRFSIEQIKKWKSIGYLEVTNSRTKQKMRMNYSLIEDLLKNAERLNIIRAMSELKIPTLILHGTQDLSVDYSEAEELYRAGNEDITKLKLYENTGHTFGAIHPMKGTSTALENVIWDILEFIKGSRDKYMFRQSP